MESFKGRIVVCGNVFFEIRAHYNFWVWTQNRPVYCPGPQRCPLCRVKETEIGHKIQQHLRGRKVKGPKFKLFHLEPFTYYFLPYLALGEKEVKYFRFSSSASIDKLVSELLERKDELQSSLPILEIEVDRWELQKVKVVGKVAPNLLKNWNFDKKEFVKNNWILFLGEKNFKKLMSVWLERVSKEVGDG